ncbi:MAG: DUF4405 domain-containing protein [Kiritimatiellae bacterium]|jgi:hypothetical protein|nr:DUF4405 domain-containing protein [Kiritimatiellia bacterium]
MKSNVLRRYVDILMYALFCFITGSGLLIGYRLAPCSRGGDHGQTLLGMSRHEWGEWHLWAAYAVITLLIVHLILNFKFIINVVVSKNCLLLGIISALGFAIVAWFLFAPLHKAPGGRKCGDGTYPSAEQSACSSACSGCPSTAKGSCPNARQ